MSKPSKFVDTHVHTWDPKRTDLWPYLRNEDAAVARGFANVSRVLRLFDEQTYLEEAKDWNVDGYVLITTSPDYQTEVREAGELASKTGHLGAIIGSFEANSGPEAAVASVESQAAAHNFRGVRNELGWDHTTDTAKALFKYLEDNNLVFESIGLPVNVEILCDALRPFPKLEVVIELIAMPLPNFTFEQWAASLKLIAESLPDAKMKICGLPLIFRVVDKDKWRPYLAQVLETFGADRCFVGSNFPPDGQFGGEFNDVMSTYAELIDELAPDSVDALFAENARAFYFKSN